MSFEEDREKVWYASRDGQQIGPMSRADLEKLYASGKIVASDHVWGPELGEWMAAGKILRRMPPPPPAPRNASPFDTSAQAVSAKTENFVKPNYDYDLVETEDTLTFTVRTRSAPRIALSFLVGIPLIIFAYFAIFMGFVYIKTAGGPWVIFGFAAAAVTYFVLKWGWTRVKRPAVVFDAHAIRIDNKNFSFDHISYVGYENKNQMSFIGTGLAGSMALLGAAVAEAAGYYVYIVYGSERIVVVTGLDAQNVEMVYDTIRRFMSRFGHNYG